MDYEQGDIYRRKDIQFKETGMLDTRLMGHPVTILLEAKFEDDYVYFLTLSSKIQNRFRDPKRYYKVKPDKYNKLPKESIIDLKFVYKYENKNIPVDGYFSDPIYKDILKNLVDYQELHMTEEFSEISEKIVKIVNG